MAERAYRPALDGLRAVAVVGVIGYHLGHRWLPGGFLGVDLFFVLSGYLITGLLLDEYARRGRISFATFYARRSRRLLPALVLVLVAVATGVRWLEPAWHWSDRRGDLLATLCYVANWHFIATDQSYFAEFAAQSPLRHAWSLAIEEQFYLVWPVLIALCLRYARRWLPAVLTVGAVASAVAMMVMYAEENPTRAYAGTDARAQQLIIGALLAVCAVRSARWAAITAIAATVASIALVATVRDSGGFYYRGGATLVALVFAGLLYAVDNAPRSPLTRLLGLAPVAWCGRISYGLYLWHWPILLFFPQLPAVAVVVVVFGLATASYYLVERPVRRGLPAFAVRTPARVGVAAAVVLGLCATSVVAATGYGSAHQREQVALAAQAPKLDRVCPSTTDYTRICLRVPTPPGRAVVAVIGDSVARSLDPGFVELARRRRWGYLLAASGGCGIAGLVLTKGGPPTGEQRDCAMQEPRRVRRLLSEYRPTLVVTVARKELDLHVAGDGSVVAPPSPRWAADVHVGLSDLARTVTAAGSWLALVEVFDMSSGTNACLTHPGLVGCAWGARSSTKLVNSVYRQVARDVPHVSVISMQDLMCPGDRCPPRVGGLLPRYDGVHFSEPGARWFVGQLEPRLVQATGLRALRPVGG
jgi:peptidoglycan/LPS O-acetylase OafA/YrhL